MRRDRGDQGVMLVMALVLLTILWFLVLGFAGSSTHELRLATANLASERALAAAESGLVVTLQQLKKDPKYKPVGKYTRLKNSPEEYLVEVLEGSKAPVKLPENAVYLRSYGRDRSGWVRRAAVVVQLESKKESLLNFAVFTSTLDLGGGSAIESYDSAGGSANDRATVGTNSEKSGSLEMDSGTYIRGEIKVGPNGTPGEARPSQPTKKTDNTVWKNWNAWSLTESKLDKLQDYPAVNMPAVGTEQVKVNKKGGADLAPGSYSELSASGGAEVRLSGGTYVFESIKLTGGSKLTVSGSTPTVIYVKKDLDMSGGTVNNTGLKAKNLLFMMAADSEVKLTGGSSAYLVMYGPQAKLTMSGGTSLYGAVVANEVKMSGGTRLYYDVDLAKNPPSVLSGGSSGGSFQVLSWQQL